MISWNAVYLPPSGTFAGSYYLVGQGTSGPVLLEGYYDALTKVQLSLPDGNGGSYVTYNTISVVETSTGARIYDSTADCPTNSGCSPYAVAGGRLYAIDITSPTTADGMPTMSVAWYDSIAGPSGASPMVLENPSQGCSTPCGDQIYFDGSPCVANCQSSSPTLHPTLYALQDQGGTSETSLFSVDFTSKFGASENGYCTAPGGGTVYRGIQAAPALQAPEASGSDSNDSVWAFVACGPTLYRFDAQTGALWSGAGQSSIDIGNLSLGQQTGYIPSSTMNTVIDSHTGHTTMFIGAQQEQPTKDSYVLALDLETGSLFWSVKGPTTVGSADDTPFNGQFPIADTSGGYVLIGTTAGSTDGSTILGIPLS